MANAFGGLDVPNGKAKSALRKSPATALVTEHDVRLEELRSRERVFKADRLFATITTVARYATLGFVAWAVSQAVANFAGQETSLKAVFEAIVDMSADQYVAWSLAAVFGGAWVGERRLRRRTIKGQAKHLQQLEQRLDPDRASSRLTETGEPREEDRE